MESDQGNEQQNPCVVASHLSAKEECSPRKVAAAAGDRLKRDEWSEGAVSCLLEAYEAKWVLRNRAKLKGQDWEDVARHVSSRANSTKSPKTQTQCKNKIESMKKRYRSEAASGGDHASSWPLFSRLDHLLRGTGGGGGVLTPPSPVVVPSPPPLGPAKNAPVVLLESLSVPQQLPPHFPAAETAQDSPKSNGAEQVGKELEEAKQCDEQVSEGEKNAVGMETDSSTPALYNSKDTRSKPSSRMKRKRKRMMMSSSSREDMEVGLAQSIHWLAEAVVRAEQSRMEAMREVERMRSEAETRRGEMDLKRTEIIANTQLEIARIFAACASSSDHSCKGKNCK